MWRKERDSVQRILGTEKQSNGGGETVTLLETAGFGDAFAFSQPAAGEDNQSDE
jgi:hypothetical protein